MDRSASGTPGTAYDKFMGRYSLKLAPLFASFAGVTRGMRVVDVGCGPGALTEALASQFGAAQLAAADPLAAFVDACRARVPDADIRTASAEKLPWRDGEFDAALSQLVLSFMTDAVQGAREMQRVTRTDGTVAACMWLEGAALAVTHTFWESAAVVEPLMAYRKPGQIAELWRRIGLRDVEETVLEVRVTYADFDDFWSPLPTAFGPIGAYLAKADDDRREALREACRARLGSPQQQFELSARACAVRGRV